jgi:glycosyltransferase involved in cell wall biosynthesis
MKTLYFIINKDKNHLSILNDGGGASELLFYTLAYNLSKDYKVIIYNLEKEQLILDNIEYNYFNRNNLDFIKNINNSVFIIQRHFDIAIDLHKINSKNKYILWSHDYLEYSFSNLSGNYSQDYINAYYSKNAISIVAVSNFHKNNVMSKFPNTSIYVIYNALFPELYVKHDLTNIDFNDNHIMFASSWSKGLHNVINIACEYYKVNSSFKLLLLKPSYDTRDYDFSKYPFINVLGNIKNKSEYCKLLQSCLCVLTTSYQETYGCVFAEALHLGVPVIGDNSIKSGFQEIISEENLCNFRNAQEVIKKINTLKELRQNHNYKLNITLDSKFYSEQIIEQWKKVFEYIK